MDKPNPLPRLETPSDLFTESRNEHKSLKEKLKVLMEEFTQLSSTNSDNETELLIGSLIETDTQKTKRKLESAIEIFERFCETRELLVLDEEEKRDEVEGENEEVDEIHARLKGFRNAFQGIE